jgi:hypothetical protein
LKPVAGGRRRPASIPCQRTSWTFFSGNLMKFSGKVSGSLLQDNRLLKLLKNPRLKDISLLQLSFATIFQPTTA